AEVEVDVTHRLHANLVRALAQLLDGRKLAPRLETVPAQPCSREVDGALDAGVRQLRASDLAEAPLRLHELRRRASCAHAGAPPAGMPRASAVARWTTCSSPTLRARPRRCIRQPGSAVTRASAPTAPAANILSAATATETSG